jgi:hypothetical protein
MKKLVHPYSGVVASLATKHQKERWIAPAFNQLDIKIKHAPIDTDQLGTFSGEIPRIGRPNEVVLKKARAGMVHAGTNFGLASEGSVGPDSKLLFVNSDVELMAWIDDENEIEIVESIKSFDLVAGSKSFKINEPYQDFLKNIDFPNHAVILRGEAPNTKIFKGVVDLKELNNLISELFKESQSVIIESDLRAHCSPSRQLVIKNLAKKLVDRLAKLCEECGQPGWGEIDFTYGLNCDQCGELNERAISGKVLGCCKCNNRKEILSERNAISAAECNYCNP